MRRLDGTEHGELVAEWILASALPTVLTLDVPGPVRCPRVAELCCLRIVTMSLMFEIDQLSIPPPDKPRYVAIYGELCDLSLESAEG